MPGPFDDLIPSQPAQPTTPGIIRGQPKPVDPFKVSAEQRAQEDQAFQREKFEVERQKTALDMQKTQRDLAPGADTTEAEKTAGFLATRVAGGLRELSRITKAKPDAAKPSFGIEATRSIFGDTAANYLTDADRQQVVAAQTDILDAALTLGTGAAYTAEQLTGYRQSYFPQLGDDDATVKAKQARLLQLLESAKVKAGRASPQIEQALAAVQADITGDAKPAEDALKAKFPEAARFLYSKGELVGYEDASGDFVAVVDNLPQPPDNGGGGGLGQALYAGVGDIAQGVGEGLGIIGNPLNAGINAIAGTNLSTDLGRTFREATGAPQGDPLASAINRGGTAALTMTGAASAARPFAQGAAQGVTNALASQPVQQFVGGMTAGASGEGARQAGAPPLVQAGASILGGVLGFGGANAMTSGIEAASAAPNALAPQAANSRLIPNAQEVVNTGKAAKTRVLTSDIRPPKTRLAKLGRNVGDSIPIAGTAGQRAAQQTERVEAVQKLMKEFGADDTAIEAVSKDLVATRGATIGKLTQAKKSVIEGIPGAVPAPKAIAEIDKQVAKLSGIDAKAYAPVIERLNDFKTALQSGKNLEQVEGQRRLLGDLFADTSLASIKGDGQKAINAIYDPLKQDMGAFIEAAGGPAAKARWAGANERLSAMAGELDASAFKNLLNNAETTPESAAKIIFGKTPSDMKRLYGSLSEKGRTKAQSAIMFQALEKSTSNDMISPQKFATAMEAMSKATGVFFSPADKARIDGITRLLKATQHAADAAANPMTGAQNTPLIAGLSIGQLFGTAALPATAGAGLLARVYESAPVRDAFLRLGRTKPGSPQERAMLPKVTAALIAANENNPQYMANAPGLSQAAASDDVSEERPIQP